jgi:hypothetical protein
VPSETYIALGELLLGSSECKIRRSGEQKSRGPDPCATPTDLGLTATGCGTAVLNGF